MDGSYLSVTPLPCADSVGVPYEVTLELRRDGAPYGVVGERCGWFLSRLAAEVARARAGRAGGPCRWPDPDDRFPEGEPEAELFSFRYRSRSGVVGGGELRCHVRTLPVWTPRAGAGRGAAGRWRVTRRALVEAWGGERVGLRAVLTSGELAAFLDGLVGEVEECLTAAGRPRGGRGNIAGRLPGKAADTASMAQTGPEGGDNCV
ncbi:hypothetical protein GCM10023259_072690 [Thermocatellispora tengchongensis]